MAKQVIEIDSDQASRLQALREWYSWDEIAEMHSHDEELVAWCKQQDGATPSDEGDKGQSSTPDATPKASASKKDWVAYAVAQGVDEAEAEGLTRDQLVERFTAQND